MAPDVTPRFAASHLGLFCLPMSHKKDAMLIRVNLSSLFISNNRQTCTAKPGFGLTYSEKKNEDRFSRKVDDLLFTHLYKHKTINIAECRTATTLISLAKATKKDGFSGQCFGYCYI